MMLSQDERYREIRDNYSRVMENIERARSRRAGAGKVQLLAATKHVSADEILFARDELGLELAGENRADELLSKYDALKGKLQLHFIGTLQTNKIRQLVPRVDMIQSVANLRSAEEISKRAGSLGIVTDILCEINSGREENKSGVFPEEAAALMESFASLPNIRLRGIMTMAPNCEEKSQYREFFAETYEIFIDFFTKKTHNIDSPILSMGMSDSYEIAVEEGANMVRVGSSIFGRRKY